MPPSGKSVYLKSASFSFVLMPAASYSSATAAKSTAAGASSVASARCVLARAKPIAALSSGAYSKKCMSPPSGRAVALASAASARSSAALNWRRDAPKRAASRTLLNIPFWSLTNFSSLRSESL